MTNRRTPASSAAVDVGRARLAARRVDDDVGAARPPSGSCRSNGRPAETGMRVVRARRPQRRDGPAEAAVAEDDRLHLVVLTLWWGPPGSEDDKKPRSPSWCRGPWSLRSLEAPVRRRGRAVRAPGPVPPGRAARASSSIPRRSGGSYREPYAYFGIDATITHSVSRGGLGGRTLTLPPTASIRRPDAIDPFPPRRSRR